MASRCIAMIKDKKQWSMVENAMSFIQNSMRKVQIFEKIQAKVMEKKTAKRDAETHKPCFWL